MREFVAGADELCQPACAPATPSCACTPTASSHKGSSRLSYGFVAGPGRFETTITRPDLYADYLLEQFRAAADQPRWRAGSGHQHAADPDPLLVRRARPCGRPAHRRAARADARRVRPARPHRHGRRHRQRHPRAPPRRSPAAGPVHGAAHRLLTAAPAPLHRHRARVVPELCAVHQLPVLHRRIHQARPRRNGQPRQRVHRFRRARQPRDPAQRPASPKPSTRWAWRRPACRKCRPTT